MKKIIYFLIIALVFSSCKTEKPKPNGYVINGTADGIYNGIRVYLKTKPQRGRAITNDTAMVVNGKFKFEGKIDYPEMWYLYMNSVNGSLPLIVENGYIDITVYKDSLNKSMVTGTKSNEALTIYNAKADELSKKRFKVNPRMLEGLKEPGVSEKVEAINKEMRDYPFEFLEKYNDNYFSLALIESLVAKKDTDLDKLLNAFNNLDSEIKSSFLGQKTLGLINTQKSATTIAVGKKAPNFSAPDTNGKPLALNDIKGKVTIIDFWASWCGPCRRENPNVVKVYNKYHDKGLEIIGVSLDKSNQKDRWLKAIEDDKLNWHHISNLQFWQDPIAKMYNVKGIPATFILDSEGTIVAKNLRGPALEKKIKELLN